jgi:flagellar P-ring protein precursor FlgI
MRSTNYCKIIFAVLLVAALVHAEVRIKDITSIENTSQEMLVGYGLVVGLNGTGDRSSGSRGTIFTVQTISNMLERFGITVPKEHLRTRNVAAVMITAQTPAFGRIGSRFDVTVASLGDASSLEGGVLLMSPLKCSDGSYTAIAQGPLSIGGYNIETDAGERMQQNHALVGIVPNGAVLQHKLPGDDFRFDVPLRFLLNDPDFVTASRMAEKINDYYLNITTLDTEAGAIAQALNASVVEMTFPEGIDSRDAAIAFLSNVEALLIVPDIDARVVVNERTGTIVAGGNVKISEVMISHGNLTIHVKRQPIISQPSAAFSSTGQTVVEYMTQTTVTESDAQVAVIPNTTTVRDLAQALNELALRPRDIIAIFQAIKQAGALNARLIIM